ncbi:alcohol dehydrogenase [Thozetella sp. PMI_491]|nr:alcohol dehydrogenase [Thozetella sp. PMI_491]
MSAITEDVNLAAVYVEPGASTQTEIVRLPIQEPGPGEVLVRMKYSGVCHSDISFCLNHFDGLPATPKRQIGGHEGIGEVVARGIGVSDPAIGAIVGIKFAQDACLSCANCLQGGETCCPNMKVSGYSVPGTFQQYCLSPARYVTPIPAGLDLASAAPLMCGGVTVYTALKRAGLRYGDYLVISGAAGGLGHLAIQYAKVLGAQVIAVDAASKKQFCLDLGADEFLDYAQYPSDADLASKVIDITKGGTQFAMVCTSSSKSYSQAMSWLGFRGTLICVGVPVKEGEFAPNISNMVTHELRIIASKCGNRLDAKECLEIAAQGGVKTRYQLRKMQSLTHIFDEMIAGKVQGRVVLNLN